MTINGKQIAGEVLDYLRTEISRKNLKLQMAAVLVGDDLGLRKFVELKDKAAKSIGVESKSYFFPESISESELVKEISKISSDPSMNGVFIELPLPKHIDPQTVLNAVPIKKDLDVLSREAQKVFYSNKGHPCLPPAVESVKILLEKFNLDLKNKKVTLFGYGFLIGKPLAFWLEKQGAEVSIIRSKTESPKEISKNADIIISGVGKPGLITGDMVRDGVVVIDFGYASSDRGGRSEQTRSVVANEVGRVMSEAKSPPRLVGDVDFDSVAPKASLITPVPGGMGPILIAAVLKNLVSLSER